MPKTLEELYADAMQNYAMSHHYLSKLKTTLDEMVAVRSGSAGAAPVRCVREWQDWLGVNGPALKSTVHEATGVKFTERGTPYTVDWIPSLADAPEDRFAPNTLMKISAKQGDGRGAPAKVFFLWSQRWDVYPEFGVGPESDTRPVEPATGGIITIDAPDPAVSAQKVVERLSAAQPVLGVIQPQEPADDVLPRCATMEEWDSTHTPFFDQLVREDRKPTDEEKELLRSTLPADAEPNAALAIAYRNAVQRRNGLTP